MLNKFLGLTRRQLGILEINRSAHTSNQSFRVTVVGASGGIGQPLALLLKLNPLVSQLTLIDIKNAPGVAADLSHIDRFTGVRAFEAIEIRKAVKCADIVVVPAGVPRKPGQTRDDLFKINANIVAEVADTIAQVSPLTLFAVITNPVNSTIPVAAEVMKKRGVYDPSRLFGVTSLDVVRTKKFVGDFINVDPVRMKIPVIGGHSGNTIVPLISQAHPSFKGDDDDIIKLTKRIQNAGTEVVEAKAGAGSATLSMAYAGASFVDSLLQALGGKKDVSEYAFVESCLTNAKYFASEITLGKNGIVETPPLPELSPYEECLLSDAIPQLLKDIEKGIKYGQSYSKTEKKCTEKK